MIFPVKNEILRSGKNALISRGVGLTGVSAMYCLTIRTVLFASAAALTLSSCGNGASTRSFFSQEYTGAAPNDSLIAFFEEGARGEKLSLTQHTGSATLTGDSLPDLADLLDLPEMLGDGAAVAPVAAVAVEADPLTLDATADSRDRNETYVELEGDDFPTLHVDSVGRLNLALSTPG